VRARSAVVLATLGAVIWLAQPALALPSTDPDDTWMVDARVRGLADAGGWLWLGGKFDRLLDQNGGSGPSVTYLTAFMSDGTPAPVLPPKLSGSGPEVWDLSLGPNGVLYAGGKFTYSSGGKSYKNLVGIDPATGEILQKFSTPALKSVLADSLHVYAGGKKIKAYHFDGSVDRGFTEITLLVDDSLRGHKTAEGTRDLVPAGGWIVAAGQFDYINGQPQKVVTRFDPATGAVDEDWDLSNIEQSSGAWGHKLEVGGSTMYVAAGGSDFTSAYDFETAQNVWHTDTSGSSQAVSLWDASTLIVGGHFEWVEDEDTSQCGSNENPNTGCWKQPRLVALDRTTGMPIKTWTPNVCCLYNGVWITLVLGNQLHVGGEFTMVGGVTQEYYARLTDPAV
jgi:hypothetical protein